MWEKLIKHSVHFVSKVQKENWKDKKYLEMHFNDSFSNKSCPKESPKWDQTVTACDASEIKERVRNLHREMNSE